MSGMDVYLDAYPNPILIHQIEDLIPYLSVLSKYSRWMYRVDSNGLFVDAVHGSLLHKCTKRHQTPLH